MAMTRRSWYRAGGAIVILGIVATGGAVLWSQSPYKATNSSPSIGSSYPIPVTCGDSTTRTETTNKPLGTWERKIGPLAVTLRFDNDQLYGTVYMKVKEGDVKDVTVTFRTDYSVTKDSVIYGVVSMADIKIGGKKKQDFDDLGKVLEVMNALQEQPFSMRYRLDGDELILKDLKFQSAKNDNKTGDLDGQVLNVGLGLFRRKTETTQAVIAKKK